MKNSKLLISLVTIVLAIILVGNVIVLATEPQQITSASSGSTNNTITPIGATNTAGNTNASNTNTNTNSGAVLNVTPSNVVGATNTAGNTNASNTNTNTNTNNASSYSSTNSSKLPYAGTSSSSIIIVAIAFAASAIYAYKKVTDYNV